MKWLSATLQLTQSQRIEPSKTRKKILRRPHGDTVCFIHQFSKAFRQTFTVLGSLSSILLQALIVLWHPACSVHAKQQLFKKCFFLLLLFCFPKGYDSSTFSISVIHEQHEQDQEKSKTALSVLLDLSLPN